MSMTVVGVGIGGWKSSVSLSNPRGVNTGREIVPTSAYYYAPESACTAGLTGRSLEKTVQLTTVAAEAKTGGNLCTTDWTATVGIGIPSNALADTYTATLTHSIY